MAQTFNTILSFVKSTSRKDRRKGVGSLSVSAVAGGGVGSVADSATQAWLRDNFVDKTTEQEISAPKIFSQGIKIGDVSLFKHPDGYVYLDETLVLKGGVVMHGNSSGVDVPSIFDSLPIDGLTIKRDGNGALYVDETALSVSGGGGVADSVHWNNVTGKPSWIGSTKPTYKYSEIEERPDLSVYALKTAIPTKLSQLTDDLVAGKYLSLSGGTINGSITATLFVGNLTGNVTGNVSGSSGSCTGNAASATTVRINNAASNVLCPLIFVSNTTAGNKDLFVSTGKSLTFNPSTGGLSAKNFIGDLTGNADSATKLATARTIWGQSFDGTGNITGVMTNLGHIRGTDAKAVFLQQSGSPSDVGNLGLAVGFGGAPNNYGLFAWTNTTGVAHLQVGRNDGIKTAYNLIMQEFGGNVAIGGTTADAKLHVHGTAKFTDNISAPSVNIDGISLRKVDNYLYLDSSLVLSGGVTMYGDDGTTVKPIWESIPFDRTTIDWVNGMWTVVGGVGSGGISEEFLNVKLQEYQPLLSTANKLPYSLISGTPDLSVYFLASNFTKANIKNTLGISDWALASAKPTYTASEVGALATSGGTMAGDITFTPSTAGRQFLIKKSGALKFNATTEGGWITGWEIYTNDDSTLLSSMIGGFGSVDTLYYLYIGGGYQNPIIKITPNSEVTINGSITASSFVGTLDGQATAASLLRRGASSTSWCVANGNALEIYNANSTKRFWFGYSLPEGSPYATNEWHFGASDGTGKDSGKVYASSFIGDLTGLASNVAVGSGTSNSYRAIVVTNGNNGLYTAGTATGKPQYNYSTGDIKAKSFTTDGGSFNGNLTGNADSATTIYLGNSNVNGAFPVPFVSNKTVGNKSLFVSTTNTLIFNPSTGGLSAKNFIGDLTGNADSATKLATARTIWGQSFDGTKDVTGAMTVDGDATFSKKVVIGTIPVYQSADGTLFVDANIVFRGGVAMYGDTTTINEE